MAFETSLITLLRKYGSDYEFLRTVEGDFDINNPTSSTNTTVIEPITAKPTMYNESHVDGSLILSSDIRLVCSVPSVEYTKSDQIRKDDVVWNIQNVRPITINNEPVIYILQLRR